MAKRKRKVPEADAPAEEAAEPSHVLEPLEGEAGDHETGLTAYERERQRMWVSYDVCQLQKCLTEPQ